MKYIDRRVMDAYECSLFVFYVMCVGRSIAAGW
jgi:hypothetical protein